MGRIAKSLLSCLTIIGLISASTAQAAWFSLPRVLKSQINHISFQTAVLGPFSYTHFCLRYPDDCREHGRAFRRPHPVALTAERWGELVTINRDVNHAIIPQRHVDDKSYDTWRIAPARGDCNDYAVTKRHDLLARGWPSRALLLAEVVTSWGEHHLVLIVRTAAEDFVLDNLSPNIKVWSKTPYQWVRVQSPTYHGLWTTIQAPANSMAEL